MRSSNKKAFTIVELVIVIAVIAILAGIMIPTFSSLIKSATKSADESELVAINTQLATNKVENKQDLYDLIALTYPEKATDFAPKSAKYGYSFFYDVLENKVILSTYSELDTSESMVPVAPTEEGKAPYGMTALVGETKKGNTAFYGTEENAFRMHHNRYYWLDLSGVIGDVLVAFETGDTAEYETAIEVLNQAADALNNVAENFRQAAEALGVRRNALAKLESFTVTADKGISTDEAVYIAYDAKEFTLSAGNFVSDNGGTIEEITITWESSDTNLATVDEKGKVTLSLPAVGGDDTVTITATATKKGGEDDVEVTKTVTIVRINAVTLMTDFGSIELDTTNMVPTATITYDGSKDSFSMGEITAYSYNYAVEGIVVDATLTFETEGDIFTISGNNLVLTKTAFGMQEVTIKVGEYIVDTVQITVVDNSATQFEVNNITPDVKMGATYLFRVGNGNAFTLNKLFSAEKPSEVVTLTIYDAASINEEGLYEIATGGTGFRATYTSSLNKDNWADSTIQFGGTGVAIIKISTDKGDATLAVEVVDGKNVTSADGFTGATNYVLLNDIEWGTATNTVISNTLYGNGFAITATHFNPSIPDTKNYAMFSLQGGTIDNLVINGPVYPEVAFSANPYYVAGIYATGDARITNSYISGFREPIMANGTSLYLENTTLVGGNYANLWLQTGTLTLKDVTTVQKKTSATISSGTVVGLGIVASGTSQITIIGELNQFNWATEADVASMDDNVQSVASQIFKNSTLTHTVNGTKYANTGIVFLGTSGTVNNANQTNNTYYGMETVNVSVMGVSYTGMVYTRTTTNGAIDSVPTYGGHTPDTQAILKPTFKHNLTLTNGEVSLKLASGSATLNVSGYAVSKYTDQPVTVNITCSGGTIANNIITFTQAGTYTITYTVEDNTFFDKAGNMADGVVTDTYTVKVVVSKVEHKNAEIDLSGLTYKAGWSVSNLNGGNGINDYSGCYAVLEGLKVYDYDEAGNKSEVTITADNLNGLTITASNSEVNHVIKENGVYWLVDSKADNNKTDVSVTFTYSYTGSNGQKVTAKSSAFSLSASDSRKGPTIVSGGGCVTPDTLVTLADGTQKEIQYLTAEDMLLVWDFYNGEYTVVPAGYVVNHGYDYNDIIALSFSDGTTVKAINIHGFYDADNDEFVFLTKSNVSDYVGHRFTKQDGSIVELVGYTVTTEYIEAYSVLSYAYYNCYLEGMLTLTPPEFGGNLFMPFEMGENMTYDAEQMQADIETYGLYTYEEFAHVMPVELFDALNMKYIKIAVGKGIITFDEVMGLLDLHFGK